MKAVRILLLALFSVLALAYINFVLIPKPQQTSAHVEVPTFSETNGDAAHISVSIADDACGGYFKGPDSSGNNNYTTTATLTNTSKTTLYNFKAHWKSFFCKDSSELTGGDPSKGIRPGSCYKDEKDSDSGASVTLKPNDYVTISAPTRSSDYGYSNCGLFQNDMWYEYTNNGGRVTSSWNGQDFGYAGVGYCKLWDGHTLQSTNPWSPKWECSNIATPTPTKTPTPTPTKTPTPTVTPTPKPSAACYFSPASLTLQKDETGHTTLYFSTNHLPENNVKATICLSVDGGTPTYVADTEINYGKYPINVDVTAPHTYSATVYLKNKSDDSHSCSGTTVAACAAQTNVAGETPTPTPTPQPTNIIINIHQEQQQQQQIVLAATVAPAPTASTLPSTGGEGVAAIATLLSLLPVGLKLRKLI